MTTATTTATTTAMTTIGTTGAVELLGGGAGLVEDRGVRYYADARTCGCGTHEERGGLPCAHMAAVRLAERRAPRASAVGGGTGTGTAA